MVLLGLQKLTIKIRPRKGEKSISYIYRSINGIAVSPIYSISCRPVIFPAFSTNKKKTKKKKTVRVLATHPFEIRPKTLVLQPGRKTWAKFQNNKI